MSVLQTIRRAFPPPRYMTLPCVGVDISDTSLKYVQFERSHVEGRPLNLKCWGDIDIPSGVIERGNVYNLNNLAEVLKEMKERSRAEYVRVSLPEERAYLFETRVKRSLSRREAREQIEFSLEENVPLSPRDAYFDFDFVSGHDEQNTVTAAVAVYARDTINAYYEVCQMAGVVPVSFEIEAQAIARAAIKSNRQDTYMIVDFGRTRMGIGIVHHGVLMYTSTIDVSGFQMSAELRAVLGDLSEAELTHLKNTKGLLQTRENRLVYEAIRKVIDVAAEELRLRMNYWQTRDSEHAERAVKKIILCGGSVNLYGLPEYLSDVLEVPVERAEVWQNAFSLASFIPPIGRRYSYGYATAIGLALKDSSFILYE